MLYLDKMKHNEIIKVLEKIWTLKNEKDEDREKIIKEEEYEGYVDPAQVLMIIPKNIYTKKIIELFDVTKRKDNKSIKESFNYKIEDDEEKGKEIVCKYSMEYLKIIMGLCKDFDSIKLKMRRDFPLWVETDDFICLLAPRIESDD